MGHTNSTANIALPQFIGTDKPTWLGDVNGAFAAIDSKVGTIDADVAAVDAKADTAVSDASAAVTTATNANNTAGTASTTATQANNIANNALTVANNADGHTNQLEMKVGLLADLHTTDKTSIVNAINETFDALPSGGSVSVTADGVKTYSTLLDELYALIDRTKTNDHSKLHIGSAVFTMVDYDSASLSLTRSYVTGISNVDITAIIQGSSSVYRRMTMDNNGNTFADQSSQVPTVGAVIALYY